MKVDADYSRPFSAFEWRVALRYLHPRSQEGFVSVIAGLSFLGIMLGVATLVVVMAVMNGFRSELIGRILGVHGHFIVQAVGDAPLDAEGIAAELAGVEGIRAAVPLVDGQALASGAQVSRGVLARGIRVEDLGGIALLADNLSPGALAGMAGEGGAILGSRLARALGVAPGGEVSLLAPEGASTPFGVVPRHVRFPVAGVFEVGMSEIDGNVLFLPLETARAFFNVAEGATRVEIFVDEPEAPEIYRPAIQRAAGAFPVRDWRQINATLSSALEVERNVMFLILAMIVLVAALNIISGMIMLVKDKSRDIAVLRAMGAGRGAILRIFLIAGASIGISGTLIGCVAGVVFCWNIETVRQWLSRLSGTELFSPEVYYLSELPAKMDGGEIVGVAVMALTLSFLATLYPSWRAASLDPVKALRYE